MLSSIVDLRWTLKVDSTVGSRLKLSRSRNSATANIKRGCQHYKSKTAKCILMFEKWGLQVQDIAVGDEQNISPEPPALPEQNSDSA